MKDIEDEIPFEVPEGWAWCRLKEVCELKGGKRIPAGLSATKEKTNHIYIRVTDMQNNSISDADLVYITDDIFEKIQRYIINKDDLYLTIAGTIGRVGEVPEIFDGMNLTENALKLTNISICKKFLMQILNTKLVQDYFESTYHQVAMPKLSLINASKTIIPVPPLDEQQRIVNEIDNVFSITNNLDIDIVHLEDLITQAKSKILDLAIHGKLVSQDPNDEPAEELLKRIATSDNRPYEKVEEEPFEIPDSWRWVKLTSICNKLVDGDHNPPKSVEEQTEYIMASSRNINYDRLDDLENVRYLSKEVFKIENNRTKAEKGDIFFTSVGTIGRSCIYSGDYNICFQRSVTVLNTNINNQFLKYFFDSNFFQTYVIEHSTGTAQMGFYLKEMANSPIAIPPMHEQARIVDKVSELFYQLDQIQNNLI